MTQMTNYNERLDEILTRLENQVSIDTSHRIHSHKSGRSPKSIHFEAKQAITSLIKELVADEVFQARADEYNLLCSYLTRSDKAAMDRPTFDLFIARGEELKRLGEEK